MTLGLQSQPASAPPSPLILGSTLNAYGLIRSFGEKGVKSIIADGHFGMASASRYVLHRWRLPTDEPTDAAINALKAAWHIVRSEPEARVLVICLELCTLHLQETSALEQLLCFLLFADGAAAAIVSAEPAGLQVEGFRSIVMPEAGEMITWRIGNDGFDMTLSGMVPFALAHALLADGAFDHHDQLRLVG